MNILEVIKNHPQTAKVFLKYGLFCFGCATAHFENIEAIAKEFNIDINKFIKELNEKANKKTK